MVNRPEPVRTVGHLKNPLNTPHFGQPSGPSGTVRTVIRTVPATVRPGASVYITDALDGARPVEEQMDTTKPLCATCKEAFIPMDGHDTHPSCDLPVPSSLYKRRARARWPKAEWIVGSGRWASVAHCRVLTVKLHEDRGDAQGSLEFIGRLGCGGSCFNEHELVDLGAP